jgi:hypothetical protein
MLRVNIREPRFEYDDNDPAGFRPGVFRFGKLLGARRLGTSVYELPPGQSVCPYHYEYGEEEWLSVRPAISPRKTACNDMKVMRSRTARRCPRYCALSTSSATSTNVMVGRTP